MLVIAHRGLHHDVPENSLAAFERAVAAGADGIETDVRLSSAGELVLFHDHYAPDGSPVRRLTRSQLSSICKYEVPSLPETLSMFPDVLWNLEIKSRDAVGPLTAFLRQKADLGKIFISSFMHTLVLQMSSDLFVRGGLLVAHEPLRDSIEWMFPSYARQRLSSIIFDFQVITEATIRAALQDGLYVYVYNTISPEDHVQAQHWGLHGVITDHPERLYS